MPLHRRAAERVRATAGDAAGRVTARRTGSATRGRVVVQGRVVTTADPAATRALAARLAAVAETGDLVALDGPLGAGKTEFARGFARGLGVPGPVSSPTFVLMAEHEGRLPLFHLDGYRLAGPEDAWASGLLDERRAEGVTVVEWAARFGSALPAGRLAVRIDGAGDEPRILVLRGTDARHRRLLADALGRTGRGGAVVEVPG